MEVVFQQEHPHLNIESLLQLLAEHARQLNHSQQYIELISQTLIKIQKQINYFTTPQVTQLILELYHIQYQLCNHLTEDSQQLTRKIADSLTSALSTIDPTQQLIKTIMAPLSLDYQNNSLTVSKLQLGMRIITTIFQNQNPIHEGNRSYIYMTGKGNITLLEPLKWNYDKNPLDDGLTLSFWFSSEEVKNDAKIFTFSNKEKLGFQLLLKGQKLYYQRLEEQKKFSLIKSKGNLVYLCDILVNSPSFLTIEFQIKKKIFLKNYCVINVFYNTLTFNNIEVDIPTGNFKQDNVELEIFSNFKGKVYSILAIAKNQFSLIEQLNIPRGFMTENDIRNFAFNFESQLSKMIFFYTPIRALQEGRNVKIFDVFHKNPGLITQSFVKKNISIKKEVVCYGGLSNICSFLVPIQSIQEPSELFNCYLNMLKTIFMNKPGSQQQIMSLNIFGCIRQYLTRTKMCLFNETTIHLLKQIYVTLGTKHIRQSYLKDLIWTLKPSWQLDREMFQLYCNLVQSFYNQDIQTALSVFGIREIVGYIIDIIEPRGQCCCEHGISKLTPTQYHHTVMEFFKIIGNILIFKRSDCDINQLMGQIIQIFTLKTSICFTKVYLEFLQKICASDQKIEAIFNSQLKSPDTRGIVYMFLANTPCFKVKNLILKLIFRYYVEESFLKEKSTAFELAICMRISEFENWKNSTLSHDDKRSHDSSEIGSEPNKSTSLTDVVKYLDKARQFPIPQFVNEPHLIDTILEWSFKKPRPEDYPNNGLLLLADIYRYSASQQRKYIWKKLGEVLQKSRFDVQVLIWLTQSLLEEIVKKEAGDKQIINQVLNTISQYHVYTIVSQQEHQIALIINTMIRSIFSFRFSRESAQSAVIAYMKIFNSFIKECRQFEISRLDFLGNIVVKSCYKHLIGYFVSANFDTEGCFQEPEDEDGVMLDVLLETMENMFELLYTLSKGENQNRIISEQNAIRNKKIVQILFPQAPFLFSSNKISFMCMIFVTLQSVFEHLDGLEIENHKKCLSLIQKFLVLQIQLTENCSGVQNIRHCLQEIRFIYLNVLSFIQIKFYQYFYFQVPSGAKANFNLQNRLRNNAHQMKQYILDIFFTILELLKYIDDMGSKQHKSFYQLMKPKKTLKPKLCLLHTEWLKNIDEKVIQFYYITELRENARQKLAAFLLQRKISRASSEIQKMITLNMQKFTAQQKTVFFKIEKKSLKSYQDSQRQYYKVSRNFQQKMNVLMFQYRSKQTLQQTKRAQNSQKNKRAAKKAEFVIWQQSRLYEGFWTDKDFYSFSESSVMMGYNQNLSNMYQRVRSSKQTQILTMPFIEIHLIKFPIKCQQIPQQFEQYQQMQDIFSKARQAKKSQKYIKMGLQFLKKKVIDRIIKSSTEKTISQDHCYSDVIIHSQMTLKLGDLRFNKQRIQFTYKQLSQQLHHLTLFKWKMKQTQTLTDVWKISNISFIRFKKFLLKSNSLEVYFRDGQSILFIFLGENNINKCNQFAEFIYKLRKIHLCGEGLSQQIFWKPTDPSKLLEKSDLTKKWIHNEISNFQYLMAINFISGRTNNDLNQYPVLPWIFNGYHNLLDKQIQYRDFSKNMGCLGSEERRQKFRRVYDNVENFKSIHHQYHFGFHYSNMPIVIQFLIRIQPYTLATKQLQGGKFDVPDRLFSSISQSYENATRQMSDVREIIPQFFYMPQILINIDGLDFGVQQDGTRVNHVELPNGFSSPYDFIQFHRESLESDYVSENIHKWIDLVFGYKNTGKQAEISLNKFYYLTYEENVDLGADEQNKISTESQMAFFGKTPCQLFQKPHPQKTSRKQVEISFSKLSRMRIIKEDEPEENTIASRNQEIIHLSFCSFSKRYIVIRKDGKGMVFILSQNQTSTSFFSEIVKEFSLNLHMHQHIWIRDDRVTSIPIVGVLGSAILCGGYWGGRLLNYDILDDKVQLCWKHTQTISSLAHSQLHRIIVSCSTNGEVVSWQYGQKLRLDFKNKSVWHYKNINHICINDHLKVYMTAGEDGLVNVVDLFNYQLIRTFKFEERILSVNAVIYPYYMLLIGLQGAQKCYSLNGQPLNSSKYEICQNPSLFKYMCFKERVLLKVGTELLFAKLPSFQVIYRYELKKGDEFARHFIIHNNCMLYTVHNTVVCAQGTTQ